MVEQMEVQETYLWSSPSVYNWLLVGCYALLLLLQKHTEVGSIFVSICNMNMSLLLMYRGDALKLAEKGYF